MLATLLTVACEPDNKNMKQQQETVERSGNVQVSHFKNDRNAQAATNPKRTLYGENMGDFIVLQWDLNDSAAEYFVYRSTSLNGPWQQTGRFSQGAASIGGAKVHETPDARLMDLCFKVEAIDASGRVIESYEPICVSRFRQEK